MPQLRPLTGFATLVMARPTSHPLALTAFHAGDRRTLRQCYEENFAIVEQTVGALLTGADRETVVQEIFFRLLTDSEFRRSFQGGSLSSWLRTIARNCAIDFRRRYYARERSLGGEAELPASAARTPDIEAQVDARMFFDRLRACLPERWRPVFEQRFIAGLSQREAATVLGMRRTTLAYQEAQIRRTLKKALRKGELE